MFKFSDITKSNFYDNFITSNIIDDLENELGGISLIDIENYAGLIVQARRKTGENIEGIETNRQAFSIKL